jgi:RNA polymerase sigma-70 factor (ECF subfamily)
MGTDENEFRSDRTLIRLAREGEPVAFEVLTERYRERLSAMVEARLYGGVRRKVAVSDIIQEAYLGAYQGLDSFEFVDDDSFRRWLTRIVENKVRDALRRHVGARRRGVAREVTRSERAPTEVHAGSIPTPSQVAEGKELGDAVGRALEQLPADYRRAIYLLQERDLRLDEAADEMGRSREAMKKLYSRALGRLEEFLGIEGGEDGQRRRPTR